MTFVFTARSSPSVFTFVVMSVPPLVQAFLAGSAADSLGTALTDGALFRVTETSTVFLVSYLAHRSVYACFVVMCQRIDSPGLASGMTALQYMLMYWPLESLYRWVVNGMVLAELATVGGVCADVTAIVSL